MFGEFLIGLEIGFLVSIPLGPIGLLVVQRTLSKGRRFGFVSGLGAALSDALYASLAIFGMSLVDDFLKEYQFPMLLLVCVLLFGFGWHIFHHNPVKQLKKRNAAKGNNLLWSDFITTFMLTFSNPLTFIVLLAVFAKFEPAEGGGTLRVVGLFLGAVLWWFILTFVVGIFKKFINLRNLWWVNKIAGSAIMVLGCVLLIDTLLKHFHII